MAVAVRIANVSQFDFTDVSVADADFGDIPVGAASAFKTVHTSFRYAFVKLTAGGHTVTGQTLNLGGSRFTYEIDVIDLAAGQLEIKVTPDEESEEA